MSAQVISTKKTTQLYSDFGLFTTNSDVAHDAREVFTFFENTHKKFTCKKLIVSPYFMRDKFEKDIEREISLAKKGKKAYICAKFNSLTDEGMVKMLYKASKAGVKVRLIVRGACCLVPQVKKLSENIEVISIVDKYLEHARLVIFSTICKTAGIKKIVVPRIGLADGIIHHLEQTL